MGLSSSSNVSKTYLSIGFGKLRQKVVNGVKVTEATPGAVFRKSEKSTNGSFAIEYDSLEGKIVNVYFKEDKEFGNSYEVTFDDNGDLYNVSFKEGNLAFDFLQRLPNVNFDVPCVLSAYPDFTAKNGKKVYAGINLKQAGVSVLGAYKEQQADKSWKYLLGFPEPSKDMDWQDKDDRDAYNIKIKKFLKNEYQTRWKPFFDTTPSEKKIEEPVYTTPSEKKIEEKDLPF